MRSRSCVLLLGFAALACAPTATASHRPAAAPPAAITETSTSLSVRLGETAAAHAAALPATADQVWAALPHVYRELGIEAEVYDPQGRVYGTQRFSRNRLAGRQPGEFLRCGHQASGPSAMSAYRLRLSILSTVRETPGGTAELATEVGGSATTVEGTSTSAVRCVSSGLLEQRIHTLVLERLAG